MKGKKQKEEEVEKRVGDEENVKEATEEVRKEYAGKKRRGRRKVKEEGKKRWMG